VIPLDHSKEQVVELGNCLVFTDGVGKQFLVEERFQYKVIIEPVF